MSKVLIRKILLVLSIMVLSFHFTVAKANTIVDNTKLSKKDEMIEPNWQNSSRIVADISADGNTISIYGSVRAYNSRDSIKANIYLQKYVNGYWSTVYSWSTRGTGSVYMDKCVRATPGNTYRTKVVAIVNRETITEYSRQINL